MPDELIEEVRDSVATLTRSVQEMRDGALNRDSVEQIAAEAVAAARAARSPEGYRPEDHEAEARTLLGGDYAARMEQIHSRDAGSVASLLRGVSEDVVQEFQARSDELLILETIMQRDGRNDDYDIRESRFYRETWEPLARAVDTQTATEGQEWVPRALSNELFRRINLELRVAALFRDVPMPTPTFDFPAMGVSRQRTGVLAEATADTGQSKARKLTTNTRKITLVAKKIAAEVLVSKEAEEDSIIPVLPWIVSELVDFLAGDWEDVLVNSDTTGTHMDSDVTLADDDRKLFDGLRRLSATGSTRTDASNAALTVAMLRGNRKVMKKYGITPGKLAHVVSIGGYIDLLGDPSVITVDKLGPNATVLSGQLAVVDGTPLIVSEYVRQDLNASGVYDGTTTTRSEAITVYTDGFLTGTRRGVTIEYLRELYSESDQDAVKVSTRRAFTPVYPVATEPTVAVTYNTKAA